MKSIPNTIEILGIKFKINQVPVVDKNEPKKGENRLFDL